MKEWVKLKFDTYLWDKEETDQLPSVEDFLVYLLRENKRNNKAYSYTDLKDNVGEYRGIINTYAVAFLKNKASTGGRNSMQYTILLKEMSAQKELQNEDKVIINIDLNNTSSNSIKKVK